MPAVAPPLDVVAAKPGSRIDKLRGAEKLPGTGPFRVMFVFCAGGDVLHSYLLPIFLITASRLHGYGYM